MKSIRKPYESESEAEVREQKILEAMDDFIRSQKRANQIVRKYQRAKGRLYAAQSSIVAALNEWERFLDGTVEPTIEEQLAEYKRQYGPLT